MIKAEVVSTSSTSACGAGSFGASPSLCIKKVNNRLLYMGLRVGAKIRVVRVIGKLYQIDSNGISIVMDEQNYISLTSR